MIIDVSTAEVVAVNRALVGVVTPRPIAWVYSRWSGPEAHVDVVTSNCPFAPLTR
jgi:hypothetical protein